MKEFELYEPESIEEAAGLLAKFGGRGRILAGGTDLLVELKTGRLNLDAVVNLKKIKWMNTIGFNRKEGLRIGALVTWTQLLESKPVARHYPLLKKAARTLGSMQIRNVATLAGNIAHASPAANGPIPLLVYEAECVIQGPGGRRVIPVDKMFRGVQKNSLRKGDILTEIRVPLPPTGLGGAYYKFALRRAMDLAVVGVGALVKARNGTFDEVRIALGSVAPRPFRARKAERVLKGKAVEDRLIREAGETAASECTPISDIRGSKEYRIELVKELTYRAVKECLAG
jgi:CO/xanthine dehydrogenase FAD-binding subunit